VAARCRYLGWSDSTVKNPIPHPSADNAHNRPPALRPVRLDHQYFEHEVRPYLGALLVKRGVLTNERLDVALAESQATGRRIGEVLIERGWIFESELAHAIAEQNDVAYVDIAARSVDPEAAARLPQEVARRYEAVPVRVLGSGAVLVAVSDPLDIDLDDLKQHIGGEVVLAVADRSAIQAAWRHLS
jgi:type IV pilus assembly protein PilB